MDLDRSLRKSEQNKAVFFEINNFGVHICVVVV